MKSRMFISAIFALFTILQSFATTQVIAHRGYWDTEGSAQNSIRSLVKADSIGCYGCEFDVWITNDDVLVVNHNNDIDGLIIEKGNSKKLLKCKLPNGEFLPTLDEYLNVAKGLKVNLVLELKPHKSLERENLAVDKIIEMVKEKGLEARTCYITFSANAYKRFVAKSDLPSYFLTAVSPEKLDEMGGDGPDYHMNHYRKNPDWIETFRAKGQPMNVWTVNKTSDIQWCLDHNIDFITTNDPELTQKMIKEYVQPQNLRVMSYNLRFGQLATADSIAAEIARENPDFVALQEVDVNTQRANAPIQNGVNMVNRIAEKTGMFVHYGRTLNFAGGLYGIAILSKHPCTEFKCYELPNPKNVEPRCMILGTFALNGKQKINFACTHLDYKAKETRELQAQYILGKLAESKLPTIIGGDFNATPNEPAIHLFNEKMADVSHDAKTYPAHEPNIKIDYLFVSPDRCFEVKAKTTRPSLEKNNSDHLAIITDLLFFPDKMEASKSLVK